MGQLRLQLGSNLMAAPGSRSPIDLSGRSPVDAGMLVAVHPGAIALHVTNRSSGKPVTDLQVAVLRKNQSLLDFTGLEDDPAAQALLSGLPLNEKGELAVTGLAPGDYHILIEGMDRLVTVPEAQALRVDLVVRTGPLKGRVVDATGKPVAGVSIALEPLSDPLKSLMNGFITFNGQQNAEGGLVTDAQGLFEMPQFPWEADAVTLRARQGDDAAVWSGPARNIGKRLELRLRRGALVTVTGRLIDPQQTIKKQTVSLIRWQDAPRITWLLSATQTAVDAQGRFKIVGLRRGEAFSMISASPFSGGGNASGQGFESPRFTTSMDAGVQDLGDIVVHPLDSGQQVLQIYGIDSREQLARLGALMSPPSEANVEAAKDALARYRTALESGDFDTVHRLTSHVSQGWSEEPRAFMAQSVFRSPSLEGAQPLRFVPGISLAYLLALGKAGASPFSFNFGAAAGELQANPDWVVLAGTGSATVHIAGIAHREEGEWRVVNSNFVFGTGLEPLFLLSTPGDTPPNPAGFMRPAPFPNSAQVDEARVVGENYLAAWAHDDDATQLRLTSAFSTSNATSIAGLRKAKHQRLDEGVCPIRDTEEFRLQPLQGLTQWESEWLAGYAGKFDQIVGQQSRPDSSAVGDRAGFPGKYVERGDLIPFAYHAGGHEFLMLMVKQAGRWQVLEPALPM
jgi:5-hydroxyisourate hydrolase-like protein (transthyretin family)